MGETFLSLLASWPLSAPPCEPSVQGGPGAPGVNAGPRPWTEGHGGLAQAEGDRRGCVVQELAS